MNKTGRSVAKVWQDWRKAQRKPTKHKPLPQTEFDFDGSFKGLNDQRKSSTKTQKANVPSQEEVYGKAAGAQRIEVRSNEPGWAALQPTFNSQRKGNFPMEEIIAAEGSKFEPAPEGGHIGVCVDCVDLGIVETSYGGVVKKQHKVRLVWQLEELMPD